MNPSKPPLGIEPQWLWLEKRLWDLFTALNEARLQDHPKAPPMEILIELHDITSRLIRSLESLTKVDTSKMTATEVNAQMRSRRFGMSNLEQWNEIDRQTDERMRKAVKHSVQGPEEDFQDMKGVKVKG